MHLYVAERLSDELPNLGIGTMDFEGTPALQLYEDYTARRLPLLLLDARARPPTAAAYPADLTKAAAELQDLETVLEASGTTNQQLITKVAYLHEVMVLARGQLGTSEGESTPGRSQRRMTTTDVDGDGSTSTSTSKYTWIWNEVARTNVHEGADSNCGVSKETLAMEAARVMMKSHCAAEAGQWGLEAAKYRERACSVKQVGDTKEELDLFLKELSTVMTYCGRADRIKQLAGEMPAAIQLRQTFKKGYHWLEVLALADSCTDVNDTKEQISDIMVSWAGECDQEHASALEKVSGRADLMAVFNLMLSPDLHSCNITDTRKISQRITQVAKIDRLPSDNSQEAIKIIRSAWDHVDLYMGMAKSCKRVAKTLYALLLLVGVGTTVVVMVAVMAEDNSCNSACGQFAAQVDLCKASCESTSKPGGIPQLITVEQSQYIVLVLSLAGSFIASAVSYLNPAQRWQQLRGAALSLESEIWKFRTRVGPYAVAKKLSVGSRAPERRLLQFQVDLAQQVSKSAAITETTLQARFKYFGRASKHELKKFKHGQYEGSDTHGTFGASNIEKKQIEQGTNGIDDHHSPLHATEYLEFRVEPIVDFYQDRLPRYYSRRSLTQLLLLVGTFSSTILAFLGLAVWAAIPTAVATAVTAWQEFSGTDKKLSRYSGTIEKLGSINIWWSQLSDVEQAKNLNLHHLINTCERVLEREREAWLSTSMATKLLTVTTEGQKQNTANPSADKQSAKRE